MLRPPALFCHPWGMRLGNLMRLGYLSQSEQADAVGTGGAGFPHLEPPVFTFPASVWRLPWADVAFSFASWCRPVSSGC